MDHIKKFFEKFGRKPTLKEEVDLLKYTAPYFQAREAMQKEGTWVGSDKGQDSRQSPILPLDLPQDHPWAGRNSDLTRGALEIEKILNRGAMTTAGDLLGQMKAGTSKTRTMAVGGAQSKSRAERDRERLAGKYDQHGPKSAFDETRVNGDYVDRISVARGENSVTVNGHFDVAGRGEIHENGIVDQVIKELEHYWNATDHAAGIDYSVSFTFSKMALQLEETFTLGAHNAHVYVIADKGFSERAYGRAQLGGRRLYYRSDTDAFEKGNLNRALPSAYDGIHAHEFGHNLGLGHNARDRSSLMWDTLSFAGASVTFYEVRALMALYE